MAIVQNGYTARPQVFDGEGVDPTDFNALANWSRAYLNDIVLGTSMINTPDGIGPSYSADNLPQIYAIGHSGAPRNGSGIRQISCNPGPLFFVPVSQTVRGKTPVSSCYYLQQNEITATLAVGDATNPRFDAVYVRITSIDGPLATRDFEDATGAITSQALATTTSTQLEWTLVQGTPATAPLIGAAPDSTWALWGAWYVPKAWGSTSFQSAAAFNFSLGGSNVFDYRVPIGMKRHLLSVDRMYSMGVAGTVIDPSNDDATCTGSGIILGVTCPVLGGRVMNFGWTRGTGSSLSVVRPYVRCNQAIQPPHYFSIYGGNSAGDPTIPVADLDGYYLHGGIWHLPNGNPAPTTASGLQTLPLWSNGFGSEAEDGNNFGGAGVSSRLLSKVVTAWNAAAANDHLQASTFDVAG